MMRRALSVLVLVALGVLGACGGDDSKDSSSATPSSTTPSGFTGKDSEELCKLTRDYTAKIRAVGAAVSNPAQLRNVLAELDDAVKDAAKVAPSEIKPDIDRLLDAYSQIADDIETNPQALVALAGDQQLQASLARLLAYGQEVCGIAP